MCCFDSPLCYSGLSLKFDMGNVHPKLVSTYATQYFRKGTPMGIMHTTFIGHTVSRRKKNGISDMPIHGNHWNGRVHLCVIEKVEEP